MSKWLMILIDNCYIFTFGMVHRIFNKVSLSYINFIDINDVNYFQNWLGHRGTSFMPWVLRLLVLPCYNDVITSQSGLVGGFPQTCLNLFNSHPDRLNISYTLKITAYIELWFLKILLIIWNVMYATLK